MKKGIQTSHLCLTIGQKEAAKGASCNAASRLVLVDVLRSKHESTRTCAYSPLAHTCYYNMTLLQNYKTTRVPVLVPGCQYRRGTSENSTHAHSTAPHHSTTTAQPAGHQQQQPNNIHQPQPQRLSKLVKQTLHFGPHQQHIFHLSCSSD